MRDREDSAYIIPRLRHCIGCKYLCGDWKNSYSTCDYIFVEGHPRPCPPGEECTVKVPKKKLRERRKG